MTIGTSPPITVKRGHNRAERFDRTIVVSSRPSRPRPTHGKVRVREGRPPPVPALYPPGCPPLAGTSS